MKKERNEFIIKPTVIIVMYTITFLLLLIAVICKFKCVKMGCDWIIGINIVIFLMYDICFRHCMKDNWLLMGRSKDVTLDSIRAACQYISYFIAFIAISFTLISDSESDASIKAFELIQGSLLLQVYFFLILSFSAISLLFFPIPYITKNTIQLNEHPPTQAGEEPSKALKNCFTAVLFMEKTIIILTIYFVFLFISIKFNTTACVKTVRVENHESQLTLSFPHDYKTIEWKTNKVMYKK